MELKGIGASPGIAIGNAHVIKKDRATLTGVLLRSDEAVHGEIKKFEQAVKASVDEIEALKSTLESSGDEEGIEILDVQIELLTDPQIKMDVESKIQTDKRNSSDAVVEVVQTVVDLFRNMKDEYMSARSADMQDIGNRILRHLNNSVAPDNVFGDGTIIIAEDISPSDTISMDVAKVIGFATEMGGKTSHAAIIAKSKGIPAVVGCGERLRNVKNGDFVVLDGQTGFVGVNPDQKIIDQYLADQEAFFKKTAFLKSLKDVQTSTRDGERINLLANIGNPSELDQVFENGGEGVGLYRTELLFMDRDSFPSEEEQFTFYQKAALKSKGSPVTIRTLDIGGDKHLHYFDLPKEENPFLGYRAIRISLDRKDIFMTQLRAILRASAYGNLKIMFPMICNVQEIRAVKSILAETKDMLSRQNVAFNDKIEIGIMIEIPSAAMTADILAKEVDFFSIGTNDLCQYTLAVDRMNEKIKNMYDPFNPGVLRLIQRTIEEGHKNGIHVSLCGEFASEPAATLLLLGMGLKEFSMSTSSIPHIKSIIINHDISEANAVLANVLEMESSDDIKFYLEGIVK